MVPSITTQTLVKMVQYGVKGLGLGEKTPQEHDDSRNVMFLLREKVKTSWGKHQERHGSVPNWLSLNELTLV